MPREFNADEAKSDSLSLLSAVPNPPVLGHWQKIVHAPKRVGSLKPGFLSLGTTGVSVMRSYSCVWSGIPGLYRYMPVAASLPLSLPSC